MAKERLALILETLGADKAVGDIKKVTGAVGGVAKSAGVGTGGLKSLSVAGTSLGDVMSNSVVVGALGATAAIGGFAAASAKSFVDATANVREFQRASGASAEDASRLVFAMEHLGIPTETASKAVFMLGKNLELNGEKLAKYGVAVAKNADGSTNMAATLLNVVDAYGRTSDQGERAALVTTAFGRAGLALLPILAKGREGIQELFAQAEEVGAVFSPEDLQTGKEFSMSMKELGADLKEVGLAVGRVVVPAFTDLIGIIDMAVIGAKGLIGSLSHIPGVDKVFEGISIWGHAAGAAINWLADTDDKQTASAHDNAAANEESTAALQEREAAADSLSKSVFAAVDAQHAYNEAGQAVARAQRDQADAQKEYDKLVKEGAVDEQRVADARRSAADAIRSVGHAQREQTKAQDEYNDAQAAFLAMPTDTNADKLADAKDNLADKTDSVASATDRQKDAQKDLDKARAGDPEYQNKLADAKQKLADKTDAVTDATDRQSKLQYASITADEAKTGALKGESAAAAQLLTDLQNLVALHPSLMAALGPEIDLLKSLGPAVTGFRPLPAGVAGPPTPVGTPTVVPSGFIGPLTPDQVRAPTVVPSDFIGPLTPNQVRGPAPTATTTTNNVTINATTSEADARLIAKEVMWNLN